MKEIARSSITKPISVDSEGFEPVLLSARSTGIQRALDLQSRLAATRRRHRD